MSRHVEGQNGPGLPRFTHWIRSVRTRRYDIYMRGFLNVLLNIIWLALSGFWLAVGYVFFGLLACIFIITIPFGIASFRLAGYVLWPFGRKVVSGPETGTGTVANIIWFLVAGLWLALAHITTAFALAITIIGLPMAWANLKMIPLTCFPFGKYVVSDNLPTYPGGYGHAGHHPGQYGGYGRPGAYGHPGGYH